MKFIDTSIQDGWMRRRGWRGRWITVYLHRYNGNESTERLHSHPWWLSFGLVLKGSLVEVVGVKPGGGRLRGFLSPALYWKSTVHRIVGSVAGETLTLFVGLLRTQRPIIRAANVKTAEGYCHYTELMPDEPGYKRA